MSFIDLSLLFLFRLFPHPGYRGDWTTHDDANCDEYAVGAEIALSNPNTKKPINVLASAKFVDCFDDDDNWCTNKKTRTNLCKVECDFKGATDFRLFCKNRKKLQAYGGVDARYVNPMYILCYILIKCVQL